MKGQGKAVEGQGKAVDGQGKAVDGQGKAVDGQGKMAKGERHTKSQRPAHCSATTKGISLRMNGSGSARKGDVSLPHLGTDTLPVEHGRLRQRFICCCGCCCC